MLETRENIRFVNLDSILVILILVFGLLIYGNSDGNKADKNRKPDTHSIIARDNTAITSSFLRLQVFQKTSISNKDNFNLLAFNRNPLYEDRRNTLKVSNLVSIRQNSNRIPQFLLRYHLFPVETDDPPVLS